MKLRDIFIATSLYLLIQLAGLLVGIRLVSSITLKPENSPGISLWFFAYIIIATLIILAIIRFFPKALKILEVFTVFIGSEALFEILMINIPGAWIPASILALLIVYLRLVFPEDTLSLDLAMLTTVLGVGPLLGASLGPAPAWILLIILAVYDYISVFKTKHMVTLAKGVMKQRIAIMAEIPTTSRALHLGGGDILIPMIVIISQYVSSGILPALLLSIGASLGLAWLLTYISKKPRIMPALPPILAGMLVSMVIYLIIEVIT